MRTQSAQCLDLADGVVLCDVVRVLEHLRGDLVGMEREPRVRQAAAACTRECTRSCTVAARRTQSAAAMLHNIRVALDVLRKRKASARARARACVRAGGGVSVPLPV